MDAGLRKKVEAWRDTDPDSATREELSLLLARGDEAGLADRFAQSLEFGTAGLRGVLGAGPNRMNRAVVRRTTAGLARYLRKQQPDAAQRGVVVGCDARRMSLELADEAARVLAAEGIAAFVFSGVVPTPLTAFACLHQRAAAAIMVTASHNPPEYNGYKVYWANGAQIIPPHDTGIARAIEAVEPADQVRLMPAVEARAQGLLRELPDAVERAYLDALASARRTREPLGDLRVVYTALHGVGGRLVEKALAEAGLARLACVAAQHTPDGAFPTVRFPNPEEPGALDLAGALAQETGAELVLANDPDADRLSVMARDRNGRLVQLSGNEVGVLLGHYLLTSEPRSQSPLVVTTIVSSAQLGRMAADLGSRYAETLTGFKWIANRAMELERSEGAQFLFGYEEALGYTVGTAVRDKDGIGAALVFADLAASCRRRGTTALGYLEEIQRAHGLYVAGQSSFTFSGAAGAAIIAAIMEGFRRAPPSRIGDLAVEQVRDYQAGAGGLPPANVVAYALAGGSRVTLRPSGTEPKIKYYFELCERLSPGEAPGPARERAQKRLSTLQQAFLSLAFERGHPS